MAASKDKGGLLEEVEESQNTMSYDKEIWNAKIVPVDIFLPINLIFVIFTQNI